MIFRNVRCGLAGCAMALMGVAVGHAWGAAGNAPAAPDVEAQYQNVLAVMKHPTATGILVTEIGPESAAGAGGLQAGDILYSYAGQNVHDLQTLRQLVADVFTAHVVGETDDKVLAGVHRGGKDVVLQIPRAPLGIRAVEVDAGVPAAGNPPPSPRGTIAPAWAELVKQQVTTAEGDSSFFRTNEVGEKAGAGEGNSTWIGWEHRALKVGDDALLGEVDTYHVTPDDPAGPMTSSESVRFRLRTGDYAHAPAFVLESMEMTLRNDDGSVTTTSAQRAGLGLRTGGKTVFANRTVMQGAREVACPLSAMPAAAVPVLAAAMPRQKDAALGLSIVSIRDAISRPGYLLIARGKEARRTESGAAAAWRVDMLHCGVIVNTYWLTDQRRLLEIDTPSGTTLVTRRVNSQEEASVAAKAKEGAVVQGRE